MFEVKKHVATARSGKLSGEDWHIETPGILFMDTERFPAPEKAEAKLGQTYEDNHKLNKSLDLYQNHPIHDMTRLLSSHQFYQIWTSCQSSLLF